MAVSWRRLQGKGETRSRRRPYIALSAMSVNAITRPIGPGRNLAQPRPGAGQGADWLARQTGAGTLAEMGAHFNRDATTLSRQVGRIELERHMNSNVTKTGNRNELPVEVSDLISSSANWLENYFQNWVFLQAR